MTRLTPYLLIAFVTSIAMLDAQIAITRLLSYRFFYHYVFFVVSLAQLGLAGAGALIYWKQKWIGKPSLLGKSLVIMSLSLLLTLAIYVLFSPTPNLSFAKTDPLTSLPYLIVISLGMVAFNFAGGVVLTLLFTEFRQHIGRLYAADLVGAAVGCVLSVWLMWQLGPPSAMLIAALIPLAGAYLVWRYCEPEYDAKQLLEKGGAIVAALLIVVGLISPTYLDPNLGHGVKERIIRTEWTHISRVDATRESRYVIDGDASTDVYENELFANAFPEYVLVKPRPSVAIIGVGAGPDLWAALRHRAADVLAVDINPTILKWDQNDDSHTNGGIFNRPYVTVIQGEGRHAIQSTERRFDLLVMHAIDTWTASSQGAYSLTENFLYTTEAVRTYWNRLDDEGVMSIRRWLFEPPRENLRLFTTVLAGLKEEGVSNPEQHIVVVVPPGVALGQRMAYLLFSKAPFDHQRLQRLDSYLQANGFSYLYRPGTRLDTFFTQYVNADSRESFAANYPYLISPARDENPFFFIFQLPWEHSKLPAHFRSLYSDSANVLFYCLLVLITLTAVILGPPLWAKRKDIATEQRLITSMLYFGAIGAGFMGVELAVVQIMTLLLGHPTYALSVVIMGLLAFAGLGSVVMQRLPLQLVDMVLFAGVLLIAGLAFTLLPLVHTILDIGFVARIAITLAILLVVGMVLGMPFVGGIRTLGEDREHAVAWAWACNGAASVIGSNVFMIIMVFAGSRIALLWASAAYVIAFLTRRRLAG